MDYAKLCTELLELDSKIRYVGIYNSFSGDVYEKMQNGGSLSLEKGFGSKIEEALVDKGHKIKYQKGIFGGYQAIMLKEGVYFGASESRKSHH